MLALVFSVVHRWERVFISLNLHFEERPERSPPFPDPSLEGGSEVDAKLHISLNAALHLRALSICRSIPLESQATINALLSCPTPMLQFISLYSHHRPSRSIWKVPSLRSCLTHIVLLDITYSDVKEVLRHSTVARHHTLGVVPDVGPNRQDLLQALRISADPTELTSLSTFHLITTLDMAPGIFHRLSAFSLRRLELSITYDKRDRHCRHS